jgi:hypothetical protein
MNNLIESSPNKTFFELLLTYQNSKAAELALETIKRDTLHKGSIMLRHWLTILGYEKSLQNKPLNFYSVNDLASEISEFGCLIDILISELKHYETAVPFINHFEIALQDSSQIIEKQLSAESFNQDILNTAAVLRDWSLYLAIYFEDKKYFSRELEMRLLRCRLSTLFFSNSHHLVGPDMIGVAKNFEKLEQKEKALNFYLAVKTDFYKIYEHSKFDKRIENKLALWSLNESLKGILKLSAHEKQEDYLKIITEIEKILEQ